MTDSEKEQWFETISEAQNNQVRILPVLNLKGNQGIHITLPCGCLQIDQYISTSTNATTLKEILADNRKQYFEFCSEHEKQ